MNFPNSSSIVALHGLDATSPETWIGWKVDGDGEDGVPIGKVGILGVREDMVGVRREDVDIYREWITSA